MAQVERSTVVRADLVEIGLHIAEDNPVAAARLLDAIDEKCDLLAGYPQMGKARPELGRFIRTFPVGNYVIFYRPMAEGIELVRVLHGARDIEALFSRGDSSDS